MQQFLSKLVSALLLFYILSTSFLPIAYAGNATENNLCEDITGNCITKPETCCATGLVCDTSRKDAVKVITGEEANWYEGICVPEKTLECGCVAEDGRGGIAGEGNNGIACPGKPNIYCQNKDYACYPQGGATLDDGDINFLNNEDAYSDIIVKNVACTPPRDVATCDCIGRGTVNENNFICKTADGREGTGTCGPEFQCFKADGQTISYNDIENARGILEEQSVTPKNIACKPPLTECNCEPTTDAKNRFTCTQYGKTQSDTCDTPQMKCIDDDNSVLIGGETTENNIFDGADLRGIKCKLEQPTPTPTLPPPPSPPCTEGQWTNGQCASLITGLGELSTEPGEFISSIFAVLLSVSGGIALLLVIKAGYQIMTSQGKPEQLQGGRDQLTAAIVGLIFLVFSFIVLQVIGFDILRIPGFAGPGGGGAGQFCDTNGNNQCPNGLQCVSTGAGRNGTCQ